MGINFVVACPDLPVRNALIRVIAEVGGISPVAKKDTASAQRAHYAPAESKVIINTPAEVMYGLLGIHYVAVAIEVEVPTDAAEHAKAIFAEAGFEAEVHTHAEVEFPDGFIVFVTVPELQGIVVLFWPKNPDPEVLATLDKPQRWLD